MELKDADDNVIADVSVSNFDGHGSRGFWLTLHGSDGTRPSICLIDNKTGTENFYIGFYKNSAYKNVGACDLAVSFSEDGPELQVVKDKEIILVNLFDMVKKFRDCCSKDGCCKKDGKCKDEEQCNVG